VEVLVERQNLCRYLGGTRPVGVEAICAVAVPVLAAATQPGALEGLEGLTKRQVAVG